MESGRMQNASAALWPAPYSAAETVRNARLSLKRSVKILVFGVIVFSLYHAHAHFCAVGQAAHLPAHVRACAAVIRARNVHHVRTRAALRVLREEPRQILLFTCQEREENYLEGRPGVTRTALRGGGA